MNHPKVKNEKYNKISKKMSEIAISSHQMYEIENIGHTKFGMKKILMMENAGFGVADFIIKRFKNKKVSKLKILAICGSGNNGGDAMVAARHLTCLGINVKVIFL
ncbi:MAG: NAD(P)H-hydrate epimerase, partial [Nitrososphaeraceae archaeon]